MLFAAQVLPAYPKGVTFLKFGSGLQQLNDLSDMFSGVKVPSLPCTVPVPRSTVHPLTPVQDLSGGAEGRSMLSRG